MGNQKSLSSVLEENNEKLLTCVHCGLCLPSCPTYRVLGNENDSPRGRIYLMRGVAEGQLSLSQTFATHIDLCLGCRACETACPSGVPYGHLLETARAEIVTEKAEQNKALALIASFILNQVFTRPRWLAFFMRLAKWIRDGGVAHLAFESNLVSGRLRFALAVLLASRSAFTGRPGGGIAGPRVPGERNEKPAPATRVAVLNGCVMEGLFTETNRATERVLTRNGCELAAVKEQTCCGALHAHAGHLETARELARKNIEAFLDRGCEAIIVNSAGCGAAMKEYGEWLAGDLEYAERAREVSGKVKDVSEFLAERGIVPPTQSVPCRVTYDAPCHLLHAQRVTTPPVDLLKQIPGVEFTVLPGYEQCCGGAGIYNLQHPELSAEILAAKLDSINATGVEVVATANPGCIMQIGAGALMNRIPVAVVHPIDLLDAAYRGGRKQVD
jgi:glycolate oxidase iron-sulfur subunit